ncbi:poly(A) RNA polymerase, mitochondrial [Manduca sexta]|uniref:Poly(A) RNA polymerase, mitochondrial n=1 Tax=Manduca sexta TaxID=7130 RepID=A0A922CQ70_MANSE|nr:poly(A) RNA polymerase, mitochondrial [Manduca sexta]KAG6454234.1 hypothetical protein O3G_MSEX008605 [Manduca sexta]
MSVLFQTAINTGKLNSFRKLLNTSFKTCNCLCMRNSSDVNKRFVSFDEAVAQRRAEARRSFVVQVNSEASFNELYGYCSKYASINGVHHYKNSVGEHFMLVEFASEDNLKEVIRSCSVHQKDIDVMALQSPFVWFRAVNDKKGAIVPNATLSCINGTEEVDEDVLFEQLINCNSVSEQIQTLYDKTALNDLGVRLRYMVARQLETVFESMYANVAVRPFGSSVNGFGKMGCDLDLVLTNVVTDEMSDPSKRLIFQEKKCEGGRSPWQRHMELVAETLELRVPGATRVHRILHARVPIVKFAHYFTDMECDLCYNNVSGVYMSELLWMYGTLDPRVRPLTFVVRRWAQTVGLTNIHPGRWITNFPLTLMVLFFLQQKTKDGSILPSFKTLFQKAGKEDIRIAEENLNCTFLRDLNKLPAETYGQSDASLEALLLQFFEFYAQFDFEDKAISIIEGIPVRKPNNLALYIVNPLEQALNVSRNVSFEECERLKLEVRNAAWQLDAGYDREKSDDWGLVALLEKKAARSLKRLLKVGNSQRLVSVKDLFNEDEENEKNGKSKTKLTKKSDKDGNVKEVKETLSQIYGKNKEQKMKFKNSHIASEVYRIRRDKIV